MGRKKDENVYDLNKLTENPEYTEGDKAAVHFMTEQAKQFDPEPKYITEYFVLWRAPGTNLRRWDGPYDSGETAMDKVTTTPDAFMLSQVVEKEA